MAQDFLHDSAVIDDGNDAHEVLANAHPRAIDDVIRWGLHRHFLDGEGIAQIYHLTDDTYTLPPLRLSRREVFSFAIARKLLASFEGTPLEMDMRSVLDARCEGARTG